MKTIGFTHGNMNKRKQLSAFWAILDQKESPALHPAQSAALTGECSAWTWLLWKYGPMAFALFTLNTFCWIMEKVPEKPTTFSWQPECFLVPIHLCGRVWQAVSCDTGPCIWFQHIESLQQKSHSRTNCGLACLDLTLGSNSLLGGYCSTGTGYLEKL